MPELSKPLSFYFTIESIDEVSREDQEYFLALDRKVTNFSDSLATDNPQPSPFPNEDLRNAWQRFMDLRLEKRLKEEYLPGNTKFH